MTSGTYTSHFNPNPNPKPNTNPNPNARNPDPNPNPNARNLHLSLYRKREAGNEVKLEFGRVRGACGALGFGSAVGRRVVIKPMGAAVPYEDARLLHAAADEEGGGDVGGDDQGGGVAEASTDCSSGTLTLALTLTPTLTRRARTAVTATIATRAIGAGTSS